VPEHTDALVLSVAELEALVAAVFVRHGMSQQNAGHVAATVAAAERDGAAAHGLLRVPGYVATLQSGWVDGQAVPVVADTTPGLVATDGQNGFAQPALAASGGRLVDKARRQGLAALAIRNSHHFAALWPDIEPFAEAGFVALAAVNSRSRVVAWDGRTRLLGTNPLAFACPRQDGPPLVWDQASSVVAQGEVLLAARAGRTLPPGIGLAADGTATTDPAAILDGGALLPFGGHKGSSIALMVEILAAALTGGRFGFEDGSAAFPGAQTSNAGEFILLIDPRAIAGDGFARRCETLFARLHDSGVTRFPADHRYRNRRRALEHGIAVPQATYAALRALLDAA
jgi:delta1-piperideine-2-carboxylate reductase